MFKRYFLILTFIFLFHLTSISQTKLVNYFIPDGYSILDTASGDLNRDKYADKILILKADFEKDSFDIGRPLILLLGTNTGYRRFARNNSVVLCRTCGGLFGDPYQGISIQNGYFSIEHYGGSNWRWTRIITFKYDAKLKTFLLHNDAGVSFHTSDPNKQEKILYYTPGTEKINFIQYVVD